MESAKKKYENNGCPGFPTKKKYENNGCPGFPKKNMEIVDVLDFLLRRLPLKNEKRTRCPAVVLFQDWN
jgi:hypothetical protein